jgi:hypothetical protein
MTEKTLNYYFVDGTHIIFDKYNIDTSGNVVNKKSGNFMSKYKKGKYNRCVVSDNDGKLRKINIGRALLSTFYGPPPILSHTADHIDRDPNNDVLENIRWLCQSGQKNNRIVPNTYKSAFVIVKNGDEKTVKDWVAHLENDKNPFGRKYTSGMISQYAMRKQHGFTYKEYPNDHGEIWKQVIVSKDNKMGRWEISNMSRVKYITKYGENVLSDDRLGLDGDGYPIVCVNGKILGCHVLAFSAFFPDEYNNKKTDELVLHKDDNKQDFRPHNLRIGTAGDNGIDAHNNGKFYEKKTSRSRCLSYIDGVLEKEHASQTDAVIYLKSKGLSKAYKSGINQALVAFRDGKVITRYGRTWETDVL